MDITSIVYPIHKIGNDTRRRDAGKILITGSIAGFIPGSFQAVYNGSKAFLNSFSFALREELKDRHHGDLPDAGGDRHRVFPSRRYDKH